MTGQEALEKFLKSLLALGYDREDAEQMAVSFLESARGLIIGIEEGEVSVAAREVNARRRKLRAAKSKE